MGTLDLSFVKEMVAALYAKGGWASVDPRGENRVYGEDGADTVDVQLSVELGGDGCG